MKTAGRAWSKLRVLVLVAVLQRGLCQDKVYRLLYTGETVLGTATERKEPSLILCAQQCRTTFDCTIFGYDDASKDCHVFTAVTYSTAVAPPTPAFDTYALEFFPAGQYVLLGVMYWDMGLGACEALGGTFTTPRTRNEAAVMHLKAQSSNFSVGFFRINSWSSWQDLEGVEQENLFWKEGHPVDGQNCAWILNSALRSMACVTTVVPVLCKIPF